MYKTIAILYILCFFCYILFSRVPDYFDGEFTKGKVVKAMFLTKENHPVLVVSYSAGGGSYTYTTNTWFLTSYQPGQSVTMIYNPSNPAIAGIYAVVGYWVKWDELCLTGIIFIILFIIAVIITGKNNAPDETVNEKDRKRKYDD